MKKDLLKNTQRNKAERFPNLAKDVNFQIPDFERLQTG